jgi:hypothetical protein
MPITLKKMKYYSTNAHQKKTRLEPFEKYWQEKRFLFKAATFLFMA